MKRPGPSTADRFVGSLGAGVHRAPAGLAVWSIRAATETSGLATFVVDLEGAGGKAGILDAFATGLDFPAWVGRNWDALDDAMGDLSWLPAGAHGRAVLIRGSDLPSAGARHDLDVLQDVLDAAVDGWAGTDTPLVVVHVA